MSTHIDAIHVRRTFGRDQISAPEPFGEDGWRFMLRDGHEPAHGSVIITCSDHDSVEWVHASLAYTDRTPTYQDLVLLHHAVWKGHGYAYQVFAPRTEHVNIHEHALHLWGRLDGTAALPEFAATFVLPGVRPFRSI